MRLPQRRHRRQSVQNIAHGAQANHEQTKLGLGVQTPIFSQRRAGPNSGNQPNRAIA
jgi:hypothetical protein